MGGGRGRFRSTGQNGLKPPPKVTDLFPAVRKSRFCGRLLFSGQTPQPVFKTHAGFSFSAYFPLLPLPFGDSIFS